jgi:hypothetical protein
MHSLQLDLRLGVHEGRLRWYLPSGEIVPNGVERGLAAEAGARRADAEAQRAETAEQRAETAEQRAEALAAKLRSMGIDPDAAE